MIRIYSIYILSTEYTDLWLLAERTLILFIFEDFMSLAHKPQVALSKNTFIFIDEELLGLESLVAYRKI